MIFAGLNIRNKHLYISFFLKRFPLFIFVILFNSIFINSQWIQQPSPVTSGLLDCDFIDQNTGWVCGDGGVILKTTNGGINWVTQNSGVTKRLEGIEAVDANTLYCVGWWQTVLKSTDGGNTWIAIRNGQSSPPDPGFTKCFFLNNNTGWLLRSNYILRTTNGGSSFDSTYSIYTYLWDIHFKDMNTGVLCGDVALIMRTSNGGVNWNKIDLPLYQFQGPNLYRLSFSGNMGWVIGEGGGANEGRLCWRTINYGITWDSISRVPYPGSEFNYSVFFANQNTGYCGGTTGYIFKTTNGGVNWYQQNSPSNGYRNDFNFISDSTGWCIGGGGQIFKTTNGGTFVNVEPVSNLIPQSFELKQNYPNPFNSQTKIKFEIAAKDNYLLKIYDIIGRIVKVIFNENLEIGRYEINFEANDLASGIYYYTLSSEKLKQTKKLILLK